jgi:hypothetical protein
MNGLDTLTSSMQSFDLDYETAPQAERRSYQVALLPDDCILQIFRFLEPWPDIATAALTCRKFYRVSSRPVLWSDMKLANKENRFVVTDSILALLSARAGTGLRRLAIQSSDITNVGLTVAVAQCPSLTTIELRDCTSIPPSLLAVLIERCHRLVNFSVSGCALEHGGLEERGAIQQKSESGSSSLQVVRLDDCDLSDQQLARILSMSPHLHQLHICGAATPSLGPELAQIIASCPAAPVLQMLHLGNVAPKGAHWSESMMWGSDSGQADMMGSSDIILSAFGVEAIRDDQAQVFLQACARLVELELAGFRSLQGPALESLPASLQNLSLRNCSGVTSLPLHRCSSLLFINLEQCYSLTDSALSAVASYCPELIELNCEACEQVSNQAILAAVESGGFRQLQRLNLRGCSNISAPAIHALAGACQNLACLVLGLAQGTLDSFMNSSSIDAVASETWLSDIDRWLAPITDADISTLVQACPISFLDLSCCRVTGSILVALATSARTNHMLQELKITGCPHLHTVPKPCVGCLPTLNAFSIVSCPGFGDSGFNSFLAACPALQYLSVEECPITGAGLPSVSHYCIGLQSMCLSKCGAIADDVRFKNISSLRRVSFFDCSAITCTSALVIICSCTNLWSAGAITISRCEKLQMLTECLPKALLATVQSFSAGVDGAEYSAELIPLIVQAMGRIAA